MEEIIAQARHFDALSAAMPHNGNPPAQLTDDDWIYPAILEDFKEEERRREARRKAAARREARRQAAQTFDLARQMQFLRLQPERVQPRWPPRCCCRD